MTSADIELSRMLYLLAALGTLFFTSLLLRGLWRPLRFLMLAWVMSLAFTPFFVAQPLPDGSQQNVVPAFVVVLHDAASDRANWLQASKRAGMPILIVAAITSIFALVLAWLLPRPAPPTPRHVRPAHRNPYLPDDFQPQQQP